MGSWLDALPSGVVNLVRDDAVDIVHASVARVRGAEHADVSGLDNEVVALALKRDLCVLVERLGLLARLERARDNVRRQEGLDVGGKLLVARG